MNCWIVPYTNPGGKITEIEFRNSEDHKKKEYPNLKNKKEVEIIISK